MTGETTKRRRSRRGFLDALIGMGVVAWVGSLVYPVLGFLRPLRMSGSGGPLRLEDDDLAKIETDRFVIVRAGEKRVMVFEDDEGEIRALDARCTHEGCTVQYVPGESVVWCACHNARFDRDGRVLAGPPPRPLAQYLVGRDDDGALFISSEST